MSDVFNNHEITTESNNHFNQILGESNAFNDKIINISHQNNFNNLNNLNNQSNFSNNNNDNITYNKHDSLNENKQKIIYETKQSNTNHDNKVKKINTIHERHNEMKFNNNDIKVKHSISITKPNLTFKSYNKNKNKAQIDGLNNLNNYNYLNNNSSVINEQLNTLSENRSKLNLKTKEYLDLDKKYKQLYKTYEKQSNKIQDCKEECRNIRMEKEKYLKEIHSLTLSNIKLKEDYENKELHVASLNSYIKKIESKLLQSNKQYNNSDSNSALFSINQKDKEIEQINENNNTLKEKIKNLTSELNKKNAEIKIYSKTFDSINNSNNNFYSNINTNTNSNTNINTNNPVSSKTRSELILENETLKHQVEDNKDQIEFLQTSINKLQIENEEANNKIIELSFAKTSLAEMLIETEAKLNIQLKDNKELLMRQQEVEKEKEVLSDYLEKLDKSNKETFDEINKDNIHLQSIIKDSETTIQVVKEKNSVLNNEINYLNENLSLKQEKISMLVNSLQVKNNLVIDLESKLKLKESTMLGLNDDQYKQLEENLKLKKTNSELKELNAKLEEENLFLLTKTQEMSINNEVNINKLLLEYSKVTVSEKKLKEMLEKNNKEIEKIREEKNSYKALCLDSVEKSKSLSKERDEMSSEIKLLKEKNTKSYEKIIALQKLVSDRLSYNCSKMSNETKGDFERVDVSNEKKCFELNNNDKDIYKESNFRNNNIASTTNDTNYSGQFNNINKGVDDYNNRNDFSGNSYLDVLRKEKQKNKEFLDEIKKIKTERIMKDEDY